MTIHQLTEKLVNRTRMTLIKRIFLYLFRSAQIRLICSSVTRRNETEFIRVLFPKVLKGFLNLLNLTMSDLKVAQASSLVFEDNIRNCQLFFRCTAERDWATTAFFSNLTLSS